MNSEKNPDVMIAEMKNWLEKAVIGLNLCPFAKSVHVKEQIRYVVSNAQNEEELLAICRSCRTRPAY